MRQSIGWKTFYAGWALASTGFCTSSGLLADLQVDLQDWASAYNQSVAAVATLSNVDKIRLISGQSVPSINFEPYTADDGSQGLESFFYVTSFPESSAMAQTWDPELIKANFHAVGQEFYGKGYTMINGPTVGPQGRTPWSGRLVETLGQDVYLAGIAFAHATEGIREAGIIPCGKHFLLNEQETNRSEVYWSNNGVTVPLNNTAYSSNADDKTLHEAYLWPFYDGVKAGLGAVMCAMNRVNGTYACETPNLLNNILKTELAFPGFVTPDTSGQHTALGSANAGMDFGATTFWNPQTLLPALANGSLSQARLDDMAIRNLMPYFQLGLNTKTIPPNPAATAPVDVRANHRALVRKAGSAAIALLKNTNNTLPLHKPPSIGIFGSHARPTLIGPGTTMDDVHTHTTWPGHLIFSGGSGISSPSYQITPYDALLSKALEDGTQLMWAMDDELPIIPYTAVTGTMGTSAAPTFAGYASAVSTCLVFINAWSGEGHDRSELRNIPQDEMILTVAQHCANTIVVINTVGARLLDAWIDHPNITAVLYSSLLGEQSGNAIIDVLYGAVNPSAKLIHTIARNESDYPVPVCMTADCDFTKEKVYLDYKYFDAHNITPRYEFGFGLSYTTFNYSVPPAISYVDESALAHPIPTGKLVPGGKADLWDEVMRVTMNITNTGDRDGAEVAQLYVSFPEEADQPVRQLRGFQKVFLRAGEKGLVEFGLRRRDLSYWDVGRQEWVLAKGVYRFWVGASSRDLRGWVEYVVA
ncbi:beta-glucosidase [Aspergillus vadensis CBS 113365]|uniref:beta-glucosidase n=1 Tax=Aspergillus vadensis (strain CBS 113365 / IMI 142717 / IBT 24658) TaxID=1448311 RepID=A0A319BJZ5_ASPVC|nr:beta-d-glucoside glucohydrolase D [Aspergillus vadensis CBS 113365]PYH73536.1 beta-d-glucoside glucohydrolase D [Aspergillus vadensis CBS 113365]